MTNNDETIVVAQIINDYRVAINKGAEDGVKEGQSYLIYCLSEEDIIDPVSQKSLGKLEIVKGTGKVIHVQKYLATIESDKFKTSRSTTKRNPSTSSIFTAFGGYQAEETETINTDRKPFDDVNIGDLVKRIL